MNAKVAAPAEVLAAEPANNAELNDARYRLILWQMPVLEFPAQVGAVLGLQKTATYELAKDPLFPPRRRAGRKSLVDTDDLRVFVTKLPEV